MKYLLSSLFVVAFFYTAIAQNTLEKDFTKDYNVVDSLLKDASSYANTCAERKLFGEKINAIYLYLDERNIFYSNLEEDNPDLLELGLTKSFFLDYFKNTLRRPVTNYLKEVYGFYELCEEMKSNPALNSDQDIKDIQEVNRLYSELGEENITLINTISDFEKQTNPESGTIENENCEIYNNFLKYLDTFDLRVKNYLRFVDTANKNFYALPKRLQTLVLKNKYKEVEPDKEGDSNDQKLDKMFQRKLNKDLLNTTYFQSSKGFRTKLTQSEKTEEYLYQFEEPSTTKLRENIAIRTKKLNCE